MSEVLVKLLVVSWFVVVCIQVRKIVLLVKWFGEEKVRIRRFRAVERETAVNAVLVTRDHDILDYASNRRWQSC